MPTHKQPANALTPPQRRTPAKRRLAVEGVPTVRAKKIATEIAQETLIESTGVPSASGKTQIPFGNDKQRNDKQEGASFARLKNGRTKSPVAPERVAAILAGLRALYPGVVCALTHRNAFELVIATALSAQTTDVNVNKVTPTLFKLYPTPKALAAAALPEIEEIIRSTGFYKSKAKNIQAAAKVLVEEFDGTVPGTIDELTRLPGVARKTANVVLGSWFGIPAGVVVDTHVLRLSARLELTRHDEPVKVEQDLVKILPQDRWIQFSHELIHHGRQVCVARKPRCAECGIETLCNAVDKTWTSR